MKTSLTVLALLLVVAPSVRAQGAYVSAALTGDIVRHDSVEGLGSNQSRNGEAIGFALRVGTELGTKWGVELEYARPAEIESVLSPTILPASLTPGVGGTVGPVITNPSPTIFPPISYRFRTRERNTTLSTALWARQQLSPKVSLIYLGGAAFRRLTSELTTEIERGPILGIPIVFPPSVTNSTSYDVGAFAGVESRIGLTEHTQLVPGVRLLAISGGWLVRPSVGLAWRF